MVLPLGVALFAVVQRAPAPDRGDTVSGRAFPWLLGAAVGGGMILAFLGGTAATWQELYDKNLEKLGMITSTKSLISDHLWLGIGRGAFESVFPAYRAGAGNIVFTHAENFPAQWMSEWGVPVGLAAMCAFAWFFRPSGMGLRRSSIAAGAWIGVFIVLVQNLLDLGLELPALSIAVAAALGSIWGDHKRRGVPRIGTVQIRWRDATPALKTLVICVGLVLLTAVLATSRVGIYEVSRDKDELHQTFSQLDVGDLAGVRRFREDLKEAILRHPAEPYFPLLGANAANSAKDISPLPWITRTLERASVNGYAHLLLADILASKRVSSQALMELRFAANDDPGLSPLTATRALSLTRDFDELMRSVPAGSKGVPALENLARQLNRPADEDLRERIHREDLVRDAGRPEAHRALAYQIVQRIGAKDGDLCRGETLAICEAELKQHLAALEKALPNQSDADAIRASLLLATGRAEEGERLLARRCDHVQDHASCLQARLSVAAQVPGARVLAAAAKDALAGGCATSVECANLETRIGDLMNGRGDWGGASAYYARAAREEPTEDRWLKLAQAASQLGSHAQAADALQKVGQIRGRVDPDLASQIQAQRSKALGLADR
jgi:tetratricopeptide (TPR) repeat protein